MLKKKIIDFLRVRYAMYIYVHKGYAFDLECDLNPSGA